MKRISKPDTARPVNPAIAGFGRGLDTPGLRLVRRSGLSWREALLSTAAAGALTFAIGGPAAAAPMLCVTDGAVTTCSGDQSAGIASGTDFAVPPVTTLNVNNLTTAITPADGRSGISFNSGGAITVTSDTGTFGISTTRASGIYAGGSGAVTVTSTGNITSTGDYAYGIIGKGAGAVTVTSTGNITTTGAYAYGIVGKGAGAVTVTATGNITTSGYNAYGIFGFSGAGAVTVTSTGNITTGGTNAHGIFARGYSALTATSTGHITTTGDYADGIFAASNGPGPVTVTSTGNVTTTGNKAAGILAFSMGGGDSAVTVTSTGNITTAGPGIFAGSSGAVMVTSTGNITTTGLRASGIGARGSGAAMVTSTGDITTTGSGANGISAANCGCSSDAVTVTSTGNITTSGTSASGIYAGSGGGPIAVTINSGTVSGGGGSGAGVFVSGGSTNTLTNRGTLMALSGLAIGATTGNDTVSNFGTVTGNVDLGAGGNAFNNQAGGLFNSGASANLGAGNTLTNSGILSPGGAGPIQTTALSGNLVQTASGRLAIDFNMAGRSSADRVNVSGTANLAGAVQLQLSNLQLGAFQQTFLSAAGGTTNNGLSLLTSPALQAQLVYPNANDVTIKSSGINFVTSGLNGNQTALGNAFNGAAQTVGLGGPVFNALLGPTSLGGYRQVLNQLSGEGATSTQQATFDAMSQFVGLLLDPYSRGGASTPGGSVSGYASEGDAGADTSDERQPSAGERAAYAMFTKASPQDFEARWSVWAAGFGGSQTTGGNAALGSNGTTSRIAGGAVGVDYLIAPNTVAGFALAGGGTNVVVGNGLGSGRSDLFQAGAYLRHTMGAAYVAAALADGWQDVTTNRTVTLAGLDRLQARFKANAYSGRLEAGYRFVSPWMGVGITPYAAGQFTTFGLPAYVEQAVIGTSDFALRFNAKDVTASRSELGFRTDKAYELATASLTLRSRLAWARDYDTSRCIGATFQTLPAASFVVNGAVQSADKALTTASAEVEWRNGFSLSGTVEGEFSGNSISYTGKAVARYQW